MDSKRQRSQVVARKTKNHKGYKKMTSTRRAVKYNRLPTKAGDFTAQLPETLSELI